MLEHFRNKESVIGLFLLIFSIITFFFTDKKVVAVIIIATLVVIIVIWRLYAKKKYKAFDDVQKIAKILFIDDKECQIVINLQRNNFNVKKIEDVLTPAVDPNVQWANIIFVDYKGVGKKMFGQKEGLGLIKELKRIYGEKKRYVIYSTIQDFEGLVDFPYIRKNATYDEYVSLVTTEITKL